MRRGNEKKKDVNDGIVGKRKKGVIPAAGNTGKYDNNLFVSKL